MLSKAALISLVKRKPVKLNGQYDFVAKWSKEVPV